MRSVTLKTRIIAILTVITIITIGIFVVIQLSHEMESVHRYLKYKAQSDSGTIKDVFNQIVNSDLDKEGKKDAFIKIFRSLKQEKYVQKGYILDLDGQIIAGTEPRLESTAGNYEDSIIIQKAYRAKRIDREPIIDKKNRLFSIYLPLGDEDVPLFVAKLYFSLGDVWGALGRVYVPAITVGFLLIIVNIILGMALSRLIVRPIAIFNQAAKKIASGQLHLKVTIPTNDELEELADSFNFMTQELVRMKKIAENANPLTKLPGNLVIMDEVEGRIKRKEKFTVVYSDLDHFKAFNDKYGIHQGDVAIKLTSDIMQESVANRGNKDDFVGHEGGDDFILLTTPDKADSVSNYIIDQFDKRIRNLYSKEDLDKGQIVSKTRDGQIATFPIMTISLGGVSNEQRDIYSYAEVTNIAAETKKKAKAINKSCFVLDGRSS